MRNTSALAAAMMALVASQGLQAQTTQYTKKLTGTINVSVAGGVTTYNLQSANTPSVDQGLGNLVDTWVFQPYKIGGAVTPFDTNFVITVARASLEDREFTVERVEFFPDKLRQLARRATTPDELRYCSDNNATLRKDIVCPVTAISDASLAALGVNAEVYVAIKKSDDGTALIEVDRLYLFGEKNAKVSPKVTAAATEKYTALASAWAQKNSLSFLQDKDFYMARVEYILYNNKSSWTRKDKMDTPKIPWLTDAMRAKLRYVTYSDLVLVQ